MLDQNIFKYFLWDHQQVLLVINTKNFQENVAPRMFHRLIYEWFYYQVRFKVIMKHLHSPDINLTRFSLFLDKVFFYFSSNPISTLPPNHDILHKHLMENQVALLLVFGIDNI